MSRRQLLLLPLVAVLALGCAADPAPFASLEGGSPRGTLIGRTDTNIFGDEVPPDAETLWLADPELVGNVGSVDVYGGGRIHDGYVLADYAYVELRSTGTAGALMNAYAISGLDRLEPGTYRFTREAPTDGDVQITAVGCSGTTEGMWTFDRPGEQIDVQVSEGANRNELRFEIDTVLASYLTESSRISAGFTLVRPEEAPAP